MLISVTEEILEKLKAVNWLGHQLDTFPLFQSVHPIFTGHVMMQVAETIYWKLIVQF